MAEPAPGRVRELLRQRAFTRIGKGVGADGRISAEKIAEVAEVVATQVRLAEELGAEHLRAVATAAVRDASNSEDLVDAVRAAAGVEVVVLGDDEEARLAFVGATRGLEHPPEGEIAVVDVGGSSSEIALGTLAGGVRWSTSFRIGSGVLTDAYHRSDPPSVEELHDIRHHVAGVFEGLELPQVELAIAVGGSATSLRRLVGAVLEHETLERGVRILAGMPSEVLARRFELELERVRLLPSGILILEEISDRLHRPLLIGKGGLREGVILDLASAEEGLAA